jgi:multiple sugar transport system permease protein
MLGVFVLLFVALLPIIWTFLSSFKTERDIAVRIPKLFFEPTLSNYLTVFDSQDVQNGLINSVILLSGGFTSGDPIAGWGTVVHLCHHLE